MKSILTVFAILMCGSSSYAYDAERARENLAEDFADCTTYFNFVKSTAVANHWDEIARNYQVSVETALKKTENLMSNHPPGYLLSKLELKHQEMMKKFDAQGMDSLMVTYKDFCKQLLEDAKPRIQYWLEK